MLRFLLLLIFSSSLLTYADTRFSGSLEAQAQVFPSDALQNTQKNTFYSLAFDPNFTWRSDNQQHMIKLDLFGRYSYPKGNKSHADIREAYYAFTHADWQIKAGIGQVFWGVTESSHLVDIINQSDMLENITGSVKLGQPMISFSVNQAWGDFEAYILPYFRHRTFAKGPERFQISIPEETISAGAGGLTGFDFIYYQKHVYYQSKQKQAHTDIALRWAKDINDFSIALSGFVGTSREPLPVLSNVIGQRILFSQYYEQTRQLGIEMQYLINAWALKYESATRWQDSGNFTAITTGFEYTFYDVGITGADVGLLSEYLWNNRADISIEKASIQVLKEHGINVAPGTFPKQKVPSIYLSPFKNDVFLGMRLSLNDTRTTQFLAGAIVNLENQSVAAKFEGSVRFAERFRFSLNLYLFEHVDKKAAYYAFRNDDLIEAKISWYF